MKNSLVKRRGSAENDSLNGCTDNMISYKAPQNILFTLNRLSLSFSVP